MTVVMYNKLSSTDSPRSLLRRCLYSAAFFSVLSEFRIILSNPHRGNYTAIDPPCDDHMSKAPLYLSSTSLSFQTQILLLREFLPQLIQSSAFHDFMSPTKPDLTAATLQLSGFSCNRIRNST